MPHRRSIFADVQDFLGDLRPGSGSRLLEPTVRSGPEREDFGPGKSGRGGASAFGNVDLSGPAEKPVDVAKADLAQPVSDMVKRQDPTFKSRIADSGLDLTSGQAVGLTGASQAIQTLGVFQNIKASENVAMTKLLGRFSDAEFVRDLQAVDRDTSIARQSLRAIEELDKQSRLQTWTQQSQQFFTSPTTGLSL